MLKYDIESTDGKTKKASLTGKPQENFFIYMLLSSAIRREGQSQSTEYCRIGSGLGNIAYCKGICLRIVRDFRAVEKASVLVENGYVCLRLVC